jgi:2'-5' RNA ligase
VRLFTAIELGPDVVARAAPLLVELRRRASETAPAARLTWVVPDRMHLTLRFVGEVDAAQGERIIHALRDPLSAAPFSLQWGGLGVFPVKGPPRVLWAGICEGLEGVMRAEAEVTSRLRAAGVSPDPKPYRPHLTLARVRYADGLSAASLFDQLDGHLGTTVVNAITLFQSVLSPKGPTYTVLQHTRLQ